MGKASCPGGFVSLSVRTLEGLSQFCIQKQLLPLVFSFLLFSSILFSSPRFSSLLCSSLLSILLSSLSYFLLNVSPLLSLSV
jgi:hypothetical protein